MSGPSSEFLAECENAPRLNEMFAFFSETAAGKAGMPAKRPIPDVRLLQHDQRLLSFGTEHEKSWGRFDPHYFSSIPYRLEEEIRLGAALLDYGTRKGGAGAPVGYYVLGAAEGTMARVLGTMAAGSILTLSCSPNKENEESFHTHGKPEFSSFFLGPFHRLTMEFMETDPILKQLPGGFDIIVEDTTFQMYSPNRSAQIGFVKSFLKDDGIFIFNEKFRHPDEQQYAHRELQKDFGYKARFFSAEEVARKNRLILKRMNENEVTLAEMAAAIREHFNHAAITWNSGNFYTLAASNDLWNLKSFAGSLCEPCIPFEYCYEDLPKALPGFSTNVAPFRQAVRA